MLKLKSFWLAIFLPIIPVMVLNYLMLIYSDILNLSVGLLLMLVSLLCWAMIALPAIAVVVLNRGNQIALAHNQLLAQQQQLHNHYQHIDHFRAHFNPELLKRLGLSVRVLHTQCYPDTLQGSLAVNQLLVNFIHHGFVQICQASQVVNSLYHSADEDEQAVGQNQLEFVFERSVGLMYFSAKQFKGQVPQCDDFYFLKDGLADVYDLVMAIDDFDGLGEHSYDLEGFNQLFNEKQIGHWFSRNGHLLRRYAETAKDEAPMLAEYKSWCK